MGHLGLEILFAMSLTVTVVAYWKDLGEEGGYTNAPFALEEPWVLEPASLCFGAP